MHQASPAIARRAKVVAGRESPSPFSAGAVVAVGFVWSGCSVSREQAGQRLKLRRITGCDTAGNRGTVRGTHQQPAALDPNEVDASTDALIFDDRSHPTSWGGAARPTPKSAGC
jgi:hypothetical protein